MKTVTVSIPTDGSVPPCPICGSIVVDLDGKPARCSDHDFCPPCGGTKKAFIHPQFCYIHNCRVEGSWLDDRTACLKQKGHEGSHGGRGIRSGPGGDSYIEEWGP